MTFVEGRKYKLTNFDFREEVAPQTITYVKKVGRQYKFELSEPKRNSIDEVMEYIYADDYTINAGITEIEEIKYLEISSNYNI